MLFHTGENTLKTRKGIINDFIGICHAGVHAAAGQGDQPVRHVGRAHLFHHMLARFQFLRQPQRMTKIKQHHAGGFQVDDGALVVGHKRQSVFVNDGLQSGCQPVACPPGNDRRIGAFHFQQGMIPGHTGKRVG